ncbi:uncharacterized protein [Aegilops tauschii subsp. strangulata]|nr:uncharacterized protein LOC109754095 [Aegilops tauschii subsp. strangulata]
MVLIRQRKVGVLRRTYHVGALVSCTAGPATRTTGLVATRIRCMCFFSHESISRSLPGDEQGEPRQQPVCFLLPLDLLMPFPGATTSAALASGSILAARGAGAHDAPCVMGGGADVVPDSAIGSSDPAVGPVSPDVPELDQGVGLADGEFSGASCKTFSSGGGDVASGLATPAGVSHNSAQSSGCSGPADSCTTFSSGGVVQPSGLATPAVVSHNSVQSSGSSGAADSCTTFSSGGMVLPSARVGDGTPAVVSSCAVQSARHSGPASANTTIRVGWKRRPRGPSAPDERAVVADRVPPLEAAIRGFADRGTEVVVNPQRTPAL